MTTLNSSVEITCAKCAVTFSVPRKRNWQNQKYCTQDCADAAKREYRPAYLRAFAKRQIQSASDGCKTCRDCGAEKPVTAFHKSTNYADGRLNRCSDCVRAYAASLRERETPEQRADRLRRHNERGTRWKRENKDRVQAYTRQSSAANTERFKKWRAANKDRSNAHIKASDYRRRAAKAGGMTGPETHAWLSAQKKVCHWCGDRCAKDATIDHVLALSRGGTHTPDNLVIACAPCNHRKSAKDPYKFALEVGRLL